jgi:hypothetical protein
MNLGKINYKFNEVNFMINLKEAIERAKELLIEMNGDLENLDVEEVVLSPDKKNWSVVLSYVKKIEKPTSLQTAMGITGSKNYKKLLVDSESKDFIGMYNWTFGTNGADKTEAA